MHHTPRFLKSAAALFALAPAVAVSADTINFTDDFESYDTGAGSSVVLPDTGTWTYNSQASISYSVVDGTVQTAPTGGGDQVLRFERTAAATGDQTLKGNFAPDVTLGAGSKVTIAFDVLRAARNAADTANGDGFVFILSDTNSANNFGARIDTLNNGTVRYRDGVTNTDTSVANVVDSGAWYRYEIVLNVSDEGVITHDFSVTPDGGATQVIGAGVPANANLTVGDNLRINLSPRSNSTLMYFDNFTVSSEVIPEPGSMSLLGLGALMLVRKRR